MVTFESKETSLKVENFLGYSPTEDTYMVNSRNALNTSCSGPLIHFIPLMHASL